MLKKTLWAIAIIFLVMIACACILPQFKRAEYFPDGVRIVGLTEDPQGGLLYELSDGTYKSTRNLWPFTLETVKINGVEYIDVGMASLMALWSTLVLGVICYVYFKIRYSNRVKKFLNDKYVEPDFEHMYYNDETRASEIMRFVKENADLSADAVWGEEPWFILRKFDDACVWTHLHGILYWLYQAGIGVRVYKLHRIHELDVDDEHLKELEEVEKWVDSYKDPNITPSRYNRPIFRTLLFLLAFASLSISELSLQPL